MDWTVLISPLVAALVAAFGSYMATKRAAEDRERARDKADKEQAIRFQTEIAEIKTELAELRTDIKHLSDEVKKHNQVVERTYKLETEVDNLYHRYDELRGDMKDIKIGGTE